MIKRWNWEGSYSISKSISKMNLWVRKTTILKTLWFLSWNRTQKRSALRSSLKTLRKILLSLNLGWQIHHSFLEIKWGGFPKSRRWLWMMIKVKILICMHLARKLDRIWCLKRINLKMIFRIIKINEFLKILSHFKRSLWKGRRPNSKHSDPYQNEGMLI